MKPTIAEISIEARLLIDRLSKLKEGETITYGELGEIVGGAIDDHQSALRTARRHVLAEHGVVVDCVRGEGVKRLPQSVVASSSLEQFTTKTRRLAKRSLRRLTDGVRDYNALTDDEKRKHNAAQSLMGAALLMTKPTSVAKLSAAVQTATAALPSAKVLDVFKA